MPASTKAPAAQTSDDRPGIPIRELSGEKIPYDVLKLIPQESAEHYKFVPLAVVEDL